jgi:hypothetical protein
LIEYMRKLVREIIAYVREAGGSDVRVSEGGSHTRIHFTNPAGSHRYVILHRGSTVSRRYVNMIRSQLRRKVNGP